MRAPLNRQIQSIISDRDNATKLVKSILKHASKKKKHKTEGKKKKGDEQIVIKFDTAHTVVLTEINSKSSVKI